VNGNFKSVTRVEVIDETGRAYARFDVNVTFDLQDDNRTLKLFVSPNGRDEVRQQIIDGLSRGIV